MTDPKVAVVVHKGEIRENFEQLHSHGEHSHGGHGHSHDCGPDAGKYVEREPPRFRQDWNRRAFTVGIGGPVGSGKTATVLALCQYLRDQIGLVVVTNDIFTEEDWEFLCKHAALPEERMMPVQTGGCPHAAIREDVSTNAGVVRKLTQQFKPKIALVESGGDNLAANFSRELADYIIYVIDVAGGDKIPRKGGPGVTQSDLLVINKTDLAEAVGASLDVMRADAARVRQGGPTVFAQVKHGRGVAEIARLILESYAEQTGEKLAVKLGEAVRAGGDENSC